MQKIRFPMEYLRVTQGRNIGSHLGTKAMDFGGKDTGSDKLYAPCDMKVIRNRANASGEMYCESVEKVLFADGTEDYVNFTFIHDSAFNVPVGTILRQGEYFYDEGGMGSGKPNAFSVHVHVEAGQGKFGTSNPIQTQTAKGTWHSNYNPKNLEDVFWLGTDVNVLNSGGYNWKVDVEEEVNKRLKEKEVMFMSTEPVAMKLGPMSGGDLKTMKALLESLNIAYAEKDGYLTTVKISKGDQPTILAKAEELQIGYTPYCDATDELKHKINLLEVELKTATAQKAEFENTSKKQMEEIAELKSKLETNREMSWLQSIINMLVGGK